MSKNVKDLLSKLLDKNPKTRLGSGIHGAKEIMGHPWFDSINWEAILQKKVGPPYKPQLENE